MKTKQVCKDVSLVGQILGSRYVVLEQLAESDVHLYCTVYDIGELKRLRMMVDRNNPTEFQVLETVQVQSPARRPTPMRPRPKRSPAKLAIQKPSSLPLIPKPAAAPPIPATPDVSAVKPDLPPPVVSQATEPAEVPRAPKVTTVEIIVPDAPTPPPLPKSVLEIAPDRLRVRTRQFEAAWFAQSDRLEEVDPEQAWEDNPFGVHSELIQEASRLSTEQVNRWALDLNTGKFRFVPEPPKETDVHRAVTAKIQQTEAPEEPWHKRAWAMRTKAWINQCSQRAPLLWATKPRVLVAGMSLGLLVGMLLG